MKLLSLKNYKLYLIMVFLFCATIINAQSHRDISLSTEKRVSLLIDELTVDEKISLLVNNTSGVERLNIPPYNWWNEALHGVARSVPATVFPQAIGLAATFDEKLIHRVATAISDEARAIHNNAKSKGVHRWYTGLTFWSPNVNIFRDPRWGRGHETYGEDPYLSGLLGAAFVKGLQGDDKNRLKVAACAKHFLVHNGPEENRFTFNSVANKKDLYETYLPAFQKLIDADVSGVMCAYNKFNGASCCGDSNILQKLLRKEMGFTGYIVSDCGAINNLHRTHKTTSSKEESAALGILSGVNVNCGDGYTALKGALQKKLVSEADIDKALYEQLEVRLKLGMFNDGEKHPYTKISTDKINSEEHIQLSREAARKSIVLLKNKNNVLPLSKEIGQIYITGNNAADVNALLGNYYGVSKNLVTVLEGIAGAVSKTTIVQYNQGFLVEQNTKNLKTGQIWNATNADVTIAVIGLNPLYEGENGDTPFSKTGGDRKTIELPKNQLLYLKELKKKIGDKPLTVVVCSGSAIAMPEVHELADAVLWAWYPGEQGGNAVADVIFGDYSPSGKLPITIYNSTEQLGDFEDYNIATSKKTYRYFNQTPLYPFGFGLSYNPLAFQLKSKSLVTMSENDSVEVKIEANNTHQYTQNEVLQLYVSKTDVPYPTPIYALKQVQSIQLQPKEKSEITFTITQKELIQINEKGEAKTPKGNYKIFIGSSSPDKRNLVLGALKPIELDINLK